MFCCVAQHAAIALFAKPLRKADADGADDSMTAVAHAAPREREGTITDSATSSHRLITDQQGTISPGKYTPPRTVPILPMAPLMY